MSGRSRGSAFDVAPRLLGADELTAIARSRGAFASALQPSLYRKNISLLLAHIAAMERPELRAGAEPPPPRVTAAAEPSAVALRVRPEMPSPGTPAYAARMRELRSAGALDATTPRP